MDYTRLSLHDDKIFDIRHGIFNSSTDTFPHAHDCYELIYFINFSGNYSVEGHVYEIHNGDILITNPNELHVALLPPNVVFENLQMKIKEAYLAEFVFNDYNPFRALKYRELGGQNKIDASIAKKYHLDDLFKQIAYYHSNSLPESKVMIKALSLQMLTHVNNIVTINPSKKESLNIVQDIILYINNNLKEKLSLDLLQKNFCISKYYISRIFKQQTGFTVVEYITTKRVLLAKELMLKGMYASDAALESGFSDYSNFYRSFKHATGISPYDYLSQIKKSLIPNS